MPDKPKLLFVSNLFPARESGYSSLCNAEILRHLSQSFEIRVICPKPVFPPWKKIHFTARKEDLPFQPVYLPVPYVPKWGSRWNDLLMRATLRQKFDRMFESWKPDSILCSWLYPDGCAVSKLAQEHSIPCNLITQGTDTHHYLDIPIRRSKILKAIERSQNVICRSDDLASRLENAGAENRKLITIYNGIDSEVFFFQKKPPALKQSLNFPKHNPVLLYVGNFLPVKNPLFLLEVISSLRSSTHPQAQLIMIGDGPMRDSITEKAENLGIREAVTLPGPQASEQVAAYMNAANLLCMSSHNEGLPNVILEALACGLPVVSTDVGGISEILNSKKLGSLIQPGLPSSLSSYVDAVRRRLENESPREMIAEYGKKFTWQNSADQYQQLIQE